MKRSILGLIFAVTLAAPVLAQSPGSDAVTPNASTQSANDHHDYGWLGLLGLAGLAGLMKRDRTEHRTEHSARTANNAAR
jgi:MYXO-CTERM domain-containing protein